MHLRSSLAREGLVGSFTLIDPSFRGNLTIFLFNAGGEVVEVGAGKRVGPGLLLQARSAHVQGYSGRYQNSVEGHAQPEKKRK